MGQQDIESVREWKIIPDTDGIFEVSSDGIIRRKIKVGNHLVGKIRKPENIKGYLRVCLNFNKKKKKMFVHQIVAICFIGEKEKGKQIDHIDGNPLNNHYKNLRWVTPKENNRNPVTRERHSEAMKGRCGKLHNQTKLIYCVELDRYFWGTYEVEREIGVNHRRVWDVISGRKKHYKRLHFELVNQS